MQSPPEKPDVVAVPAEALTRLLRAITIASEGSFVEALELLDKSSPGQFGTIEHVLRSFIKDYKISVEQSALSIEEFTASQRALERQLHTTAQQQRAIQKLSAPIIDVWNGIVTIPLVGDLDSIRMQELGERLLNHIQSTRTSWVLLDLTGAGQLDAQVASSLVKLSHAVRMMGAQCLLTGIGESVARLLVTIGASVEGIQSVSSLREGLKYCLSQPNSMAGVRHR